jgi:hypothetical protein
MTQITPTFQVFTFSSNQTLFSNPTMEQQSNQITITTTPCSEFSTPPINSLQNINKTNCMEQLLVHCANAIESNNATLAQQILWVRP